MYQCHLKTGKSKSFSSPWLHGVVLSIPSPPKKREIIGVIIQKHSILWTNQKKKGEIHLIPSSLNLYNSQKSTQPLQSITFTRCFQLNIFTCTGKEKIYIKWIGLYPISEAISGRNFASRAAWNLFSAYRAMSSVIREYFVYKTRRAEEHFPATGYQNTFPSLE